MSLEFWEAAANRDPLWAILSDPSKSGRRWELGEFFETGKREISLLLYQLEQLQGLPRLGKALDFGCGVGRLTQPLSDSFVEVVGVDISPTMIRIAERLNRRPGKVRYLTGTGDGLGQFMSDSFDFIYSDIVLQHIPPASSQRYISEFLRVLAPGGVVVFQLPSHRRPEAERPPIPVPMPESAYSALLRAGNALPVSVVPNQAFEVVLHVTNTSDVPWDRSKFGAMRIGNHWLSTMGTMLIQDDGRALIPLLVQPSDTFMVGLTVTSPRRAGQYFCEFDLVHEGVSWFADKNSVTLRQHVTVGTEQDAGGHGTLPFTSSDVGTFPDIYHDLRHDASEIENFPMFGVLHETALDLISRCGGTLFHVEEDERCGREWVGFRYYARKI